MITGDLGLYGERLAVVLGFITLGLFIGVGLSCRSFVSVARRTPLKRVTDSKAYGLLFRYHSFLWYGFFAILFLHMFIGFMHTDIPKAGDPSAPIHLAILVFAVSLLGSTVLTFSNCRTFSRILGLFGNRASSRRYKLFYRLHSYFWVILLLVLLGHLTASYLHIGFWPTSIE